MDTSIKTALKNAKRKQLLKTAIISIIAVLILLPVLYKGGNFFASKSSTRLHDQLFLHNAIAEPNIQINSQVTSNSSMLGGNIITNRSKNINGYLVQWSTLTSSYSWLRTKIDHNELIPGSYSSETNFYEYDKQTKEKVASFYHPAIPEYYDGVQNEISELVQLDNHVAEVALSFDQPYSLKEIKKNIPDNLNIVWLYMTSAVGDPTVYGFATSDASYEDFVDALEKYDPRAYNTTIQDFLTANKNKKIDEVEILGAMVTGQTQNFKALENQAFIRGASVGATAQIVPYIKPEK